MTEPQPRPSYDQPPTPAPLPATGEGTGPGQATASSLTPDGGGRGGGARRWLAGAMLVTVGVVAGGGAAHAFTASHITDVPVDVTVAGDGRGPGHRPFDGPPAGVLQDQGTGAQPGGADGEST